VVGRENLSRGGKEKSAGLGKSKSPGVETARARNTEEEHASGEGRKGKVGSVLLTSRKLREGQSHHGNLFQGFLQGGALRTSGGGIGRGDNLCGASSCR